MRVLGIFIPAQPCGVSGLGATPGTMGLRWEGAAWVRVNLGALSWCRCNGDLPLLGRDESRLAPLAACSSRHGVGDKGCWRGQEAISLCDRDEGPGL